MQNDPSLTPVLVGVGEINDRTSGHDTLDSLQLMVAALAAADVDAGGGWLAQCERIFVVPQLSFSEIDVPGGLAAATGLELSSIRQADVPSGDTPIRLLNEAANAIGSGEVACCAIVGAEAMRTALRSGKPLFPNAHKNASKLRRRYGLIQPSDIYPLYENACRAAEGQTLAEGQAETGLIWSRMSDVAAKSNGAWLRASRSPAEIIEQTDDNRPIAFPYTKLMIANASVNQGAAAIVTNLATALLAGVPEDRLVYIGAGAAANEPDEAMDRPAWTIPTGMEVAIEQTLARNAIGPGDIDHVELYSCFPCVPKMARRALGWPADRPVTVHGGLTFGGGPVANYMTHAIGGMVRRLRIEGRIGFLFGNGGFCSHNHCILLSRDAQVGGFLPQDFDVQTAADARRGPIPSLSDAVEGKFPIETYTVMYARDGSPQQGVVLSCGPDRRRIIARVDPDDSASVDFLTDGKQEPVGKIGHNRRRGDMLIWSIA